MRIGIIDLGTNSVRFDIHELRLNGTTDKLVRERELIRLGDSVFTTNQISPEALRRSLEVFRRYKKQGDDYEVERYVAVGTSALRDARNRQEFIEKIEEATGIKLEVITGDEEAALIAKGVIENEKINEGTVAIVDIGGGSTEIIVTSGESVFHSTSLDLGTLRLQQVYLKTHPPRAEREGEINPLNHLRHTIRTSLSATIIREGWPAVDKVVGASGTVRALTRIAKHQGDKAGTIEATTLTNLVERMSRLTLKELLEIPGMEPKRVDIILGGAVLLDEIVEIFRVKKVLATEFSLRDGLLLREKEKFRSA